VWSKDERFFLAHLKGTNTVNAYFRRTSDNYPALKAEELASATQQLSISGIIFEFVLDLWASDLAFKFEQSRDLVLPV
jgi:hypothetical protein